MFAYVFEDATPFLQTIPFANSLLSHWDEIAQARLKKVARDILSQRLVCKGFDRAVLCSERRPLYQARMLAPGIKFFVASFDLHPDFGLPRYVAVPPDRHVHDDVASFLWRLWRLGGRVSIQAVASNVPGFAHKNCIPLLPAEEAVKMGFDGTVALLEITLVDRADKTIVWLGATNFDPEIFDSHKQFAIDAAASNISLLCYDEVGASFDLAFLASPTYVARMKDYIGGDFFFNSEKFGGCICCDLSPFPFLVPLALQ